MGERRVRLNDKLQCIHIYIRERLQKPPENPSLIETMLGIIFIIAVVFIACCISIVVDWVLSDTWLYRVIDLSWKWIDSFIPTTEQQVAFAVSPYGMMIGGCIICCGIYNEFNKVFI